MRIIEYYDYDAKEWFGMDWSDVVSGTMIRMFEDDGTPVADGTGVFEMQTVSNSYQQTISGSGEVWTIDIADPDPHAVSRREQ